MGPPIHPAVTRSRYPSSMEVRVPLDIEYWTDPFCVWAFTAEPHLDHLVEQYGDQLEVRHRIVPVFGSIVRRFAAGGSWAEAGPAGRAAATARIAREHRPGVEVTGQVWLDDPPASSWSASLAVKAVSLLEADELAPHGATAAYLLGLRDRFFVDNVNMARRSHQLALAEEQRLPLDAIVDRLDDGRALAALYEDHEDRIAANVTGSPTYLFEGGRTRIYGNFRVSVLEATVKTYLEGASAGCSDC